MRDSLPLPPFPPSPTPHLGHILDDGGPQQVHEVCGGDHCVPARDLHPGGQDEHIAQGNEGTGAVLILREGGRGGVKGNERERERERERQRERERERERERGKGQHLYNCCSVPCMCVCTCTSTVHYMNCTRYSGLCVGVTQDQQEG